MDEVFGQDNFINEIIWHYTSSKSPSDSYGRKHDNILHYSKNQDYYFKHILKKTSEFSKSKYNLKDEKGLLYKMVRGYKKYYKEEIPIDDVWDIPLENVQSREIQNYPTQKPVKLLEQILETASQEGDIVADFFIGSGTTCAVAQRMGRRWIGCDINKGAIQITTKRINQIIEDEQKDIKDFTGSLGFKVVNVNDYDVFKNEVLAKEIVMEMYGIEPIKRSYFDGVLGKDLVKIMPMNRVLNKMDVRSILKNTQDSIGNLTVKPSSKAKDAVYEERVRVICSGVEYDVLHFLKKENKTGVVVEINDILESTKELVFKEYPESKIVVKVKDKKLEIDIKEFYSPLLMRKLEIENEKVLKKEDRAKVDDFKQIIDSVAIDVDYNGKLFNAEVMDLPQKKETIKAKYSWDYEKKGKYTVAIKVIDVLGEEYFETFEVNA
jgi:site-specific DNA-methyltransferase (adenine-specific)/adenine-specific DNA-methyltransferase